MITLIWLHFIADFLLQGDEMAIKKSSSIKYLIAHGLIYSLPFVLFGTPFWAFTFVTHTVTDGITSKITKYFFTKHDRHGFFITIGFDQAVHLTCLFYALKHF